MKRKAYNNPTIHIVKLQHQCRILSGSSSQISVPEGSATLNMMDEEEDLFWSEGQLELIEKIGVQNWLLLQM